MSRMNFLEKLLDGVEVEWIEVGNLISPQRGRRLVKSQLEEFGSYAVYQNSMKPLGYYHENNVKAGTTFVIVAGAAGEIGFSDDPFWAADDVYFFPPSSILNNKYLYHFILTKKHEISSQVRRASVPRLSISAVEKLEIPIPCPENPKKSLEIQAEIVRILDAMTAHTAELTAELTARKKQYNYYRDQLFSFEDGEVEWKELGGICRFINGRAYKQPELLGSGKYPVLRVGNFFTNGNWYYSDLELEADKYCDKGDLLYAWSASFGPKIWDSGKVIYHYHIWKVVPDLNLISKKYLYYLLAWDAEALKTEHGTGSTMMHIGKGSIEKRLVPIPSLKEQARIVSLLDKFDTLTTSITEGLPREIELRQKQYAYYRDLLLSFPPSQAA